MINTSGIQEDSRVSIMSHWYLVLSLFKNVHVDFYFMCKCFQAFASHLTWAWEPTLKSSNFKFSYPLSHLSSHIILSCFRFLNLSDGYRTTQKVKKKIAQHPGMLEKHLIPALSRSQWMGRLDLHSESLIQRRKEDKEAGCHRKETCNNCNIML